MIKSESMHTKIAPELKNQGNAILASIGISPDEAITMFYHQIVIHRNLPFDIKTPNKETVEAMQELTEPESRRRLKRFSSFKEMMSDLDT
ncbi:MAG: type II toxin-antitoxin system RelB/DinJ family antitoxin [Pseudomonadota bacterium]